MAQTARAQLYCVAGGAQKWQLYLEQFCNSLDSLNTRKAYRTAVRRAFQVFPTDDPRRIRPQDVARFKATLEDSKPATIAARLHALRAFFQYLVAVGVVRNDPTAAIKVPRVWADKPRAFTFKQAKRVVAQVDRSTLVGCRDAAILSLQFNGARIAEVSGLNVGSIELLTEDGQQFCRASVVGKGRKSRSMDLGVRVYELITEYLERRGGPRGPDDPLFLSSVTGFCKEPRRMPADAIYRRFKHYCRKARVKTNGAHDARHSFVLWAEQAGASIYDVSLHIGHQDLRTTSVYLKRLDNRRNPASRYVADLF